MEVRPLHDRLLIKRLEEETRTAGGIIIPDTQTEKPAQGEVLSTGPGQLQENGSWRSLDVKAGDKVLFGKYAGTEVKIDGKELIIMKENEILGVIQ